MTPITRKLMLIAWRQRLQPIWRRVVTITRVEKPERGPLQKAFREVLLRVGQVIAFAAALAEGNAGFLSLLNRFSVNPPTSADYVSLMTTISGMGGVLIGLYYATIGTISSAAYRTTPVSVRKAMLRDKIGNQYMHGLVAMTILGLVLAAFPAMGFSPILLAVPVMTFMAAFAAGFFVYLGWRAFSFFDPTELSRQIIAEIKHDIDSVCAPSKGFDDTDHQDRKRQRVLAHTETLVTLTGIATEQNHLKGEPLTRLGHDLIELLVFYQSKKLRIPTQSAWFPRRFEHKDWNNVPQFEVELATQAGLGVTADVKVERHQFETLILPLILDCLGQAMTALGKNQALDLTMGISYYAQALARSGETQQAHKLMLRTHETIHKAIQTLKIARNTSAPNDDLLPLISLVQCLARMPLVILKGTHDHWASLNLDDLGLRLTAPMWKSPHGIYNDVLPSPGALAELEDLRQGVLYELKLSGQPVTPLWHHKVALKRILAKRFAGDAEMLVRSLPTAMASWESQFVTEGHHWPAATIMESHHKYLRDLSKVRETVLRVWDVQLGLDLHGESDVPVQFRMRFDTWLQLAMNAHHQRLAIHAQRLSTEYRQRDVPDYAGMFFDFALETAIKALVDNDPTSFNSVVEHLFQSGLHRFNDTRKNLHRRILRHPSTWMSVYSPLDTLMSLSGMALLMSEYHQNADMMSPLRQCWDKLLDNVDTAVWTKLVADLLFVKHDLENHGHSVKNPDEMFWNFIEANDAMAAVFDLSLDQGVETAHQPSDRREHQGPIMRTVLANLPWQRISMLGIFYARYLKQRDEFQSLNLGGQLDQLANAR